YVQFVQLHRNETNTPAKIVRDINYPKLIRNYLIIQDPERKDPQSFASVNSVFWPPANQLPSLPAFQPEKLASTNDPLAFHYRKAGTDMEIDHKQDSAMLQHPDSKVSGIFASNAGQQYFCKTVLQMDFQMKQYVNNYIPDSLD
ncbi:unnamed protein product, partial [Ilex paraguariensis]